MSDERCSSGHELLPEVRDYPSDSVPIPVQLACRVTHAPGGCYVCWTHRQFMPWSKAFVSWSGCDLDHYGFEQSRAALRVARDLERGN